ncbi:hypothetical protein Hypma_009202 [Hypsizygus marmoreus]|uniref:Uncharacterized protein n=1 Tax=Hypsizygus marmoreus TaxID=39966 RepID=A0A369JTL0_HYPMA|nr:hypothetical protein Hypma_009202 [Hypsizygus marmoreus]
MGLKKIITLFSSVVLNISTIYGFPFDARSLTPRNRTGSDIGLRATAASVTYTGLIQVRALDGRVIGFVRNQDGLLPINGVNFGSNNQDLHVTFTTPTTGNGPFDILATDPKFTAPFYVGTALIVLIGIGSAVSGPFSNVIQSQSILWNINPTTTQLTAQYINPDGSHPTTVIGYDGLRNSLFLTGDVAAWNSQNNPLIPATAVNFFFVPSTSPPVTYNGRIQVRAGDTGRIIGFVRNVAGLLPVNGVNFGTPDQDLRVTFTTPGLNGPFNILATNPAFTAPFYIGASSSATFGPGSGNSGLFLNVDQTPLLAPPTATGQFSIGEWGFWFLDSATGKLAAQYVNPDGTRPATVIGYDGLRNSLFFTGDVGAWNTLNNPLLPAAVVELFFQSS